MLYNEPMQSEVTRGFAAVNGTELYYEDAGSGAAVVLIHGLCLSCRMWDSQVDVLADRFRVIRYDVRGFGKSALPDKPFLHADDLRGLLDYLDVPAAHVVGLSMGGRIALQHAVLYPEQSCSLALVDSAIDGFDWDKSWDVSLDAIKACGHREGAKAANRMWLNHELFASARERPECAAKLTQIVGADSGWIWLHESLAQGIDPAARMRLAEIRVPTLVIVGKRDLPDFQAIAEILAAGIPGAEKVEMPGVGHMSNMEDPAAFNKVLLGFLPAV